MLAVLLNGSPARSAALSVEDRGLAYGDGVFETMLLRAGRVCFQDDHLTRLELGCKRLGISPPDLDLIRAEVEELTQVHANGIIKLIVTRGSTGRGYFPEAVPPTRIALLYPPLPDGESRAIRARWCEMRLARNARLAGIKHLNRLEQVLARGEWNDPTIAEGLMLDTEGEVIEGVNSNVFAVIDGVLTTPDLRFCGVRGVMRQRVLDIARASGIETAETVLWPDEALGASELFLTNAIRGIRSVVQLDDRRWVPGPIAQRICDALAGQT